MDSPPPHDAPFHPGTHFRPGARMPAPAGRPAPWRLSPRAWLALLGVSCAALASAGTAAWLAGSPLARGAVIVLALLAFGLILALARLLAVQAAARHGPGAASAGQAPDLESLVQARTRELAALAAHLQRQSEQERSELASNLHDELGGLLTAAKMDLSWLQPRVPDPVLQERLAQLGGVLDEAMDLKRRVVEELRPSLLDHFGLPTALRAYVDAACAKAGLRAQIALPEDGAPLPRDTAIALFRIVEEGVTNIIRHADARQVTLHGELEGGSCRLTLGDDGRGFDASDPAFRASHGIMGMRQRVRTLGGRLELDSAPGAGTTLRVSVPVPAGQPSVGR